MKIQHFVHGDFKPCPSQLTAEEVGKFYDNFVAASIDVVPVMFWGSEWMMLLGLRSQEPKVWWSIGRTMKPGESPTETVLRTLSEEFGLKPSARWLDRSLSFACINSSVFPLRDQPPRENGRHCFVAVYALELNYSDFAKTKFNVSQGSKYRKMQWFPVSEVTNRRKFDPVVRVVARTIASRL